jgi:atypical dual specificity phosphatase
MNKLGIVFLVLVARTMATYEIKSIHPMLVDACLKERHDHALAMGLDAGAYTMADLIIPRLWVGSVCAARSQAFLDEHKITHVISMANEWPLVSANKQTRPLYEFIQGLDDSTHENPEKVTATLVSAARHIQTILSNDPAAHVLVFCNMGVSRSASAVAAYLILIGQGEQYLQQLRLARPVAAPNALYRHILNQLVHKAQAADSL